MLGARNYRSCYYPFTASQWQELEQQALVFRYFVSGVPVPPDLISTVIKTPFTSPGSSARLFPQQHPLPMGWGCFQVGYGRKEDPEPGRCRRTDGKKWRCSKEAYPDSKYCERHMHRGKSKSKNKKQFEPFTTNPTNNVINTNNKATTTTTTTPTLRSCYPSPTLLSCSVSSSDHTTSYAHKSPSEAFLSSSSHCYPFLSPHSSSSSSNKRSSDSTESAQNQTAPLWLLDQLHYDQPSRQIGFDSATNYGS